MNLISQILQTDAKKSTENTLIFTMAICVGALWMVKAARA